MKMISETRCSGPIRKALLFFFAIITVLPCTVTAGTDADIKRNYEGSLFKMTEKKLFGIEIKILEPAPGEGGNKAELIIYDSAGNDVENAEITVVPNNLESGNGVTNRPAVVEKGGGFYSVDHMLPGETGPHAITITVKKEGVEDTVIFDFPEEKAMEAEDKTFPEEQQQGKDAEVEDKSSPAVTYDKYRTILEPLSALPPIPADNTMTADKVMLGKMLFWETMASRTGTTSCASCHHPSYYGAEPLGKSVGIGGEIYKRNAPTVLNSAFMKTLFWAGESPSLEDQTFNAVTSHMDMHNLPEEVTATLNGIAEYKELSARVFGGPLTEINMMKAIAAFVRTLITPDYPLARWLQGDENALTEDQKKGMELFVDKGCISCHYGAVFSGPGHEKAIGIDGHEHDEILSQGVQLHKVLLTDAKNDLGRADKTKKETDKYFFRVPQLLNVAKTPPYSHAGIIDTLNTMIDFMASDMLKIQLTASEIDDIAAFLRSLTGEMPHDFMSVPLLPTGRTGADKVPGVSPSGPE